MIAPIYHELSEKLERYIAENGITGKMPGVLNSAGNSVCIM